MGNECKDYIFYKSIFIEVDFNKTCDSLFRQKVWEMIEGFGIP